MKGKKNRILSIAGMAVGLVVIAAIACTSAVPAASPNDDAKNQESPTSPIDTGNANEPPTSSQPEPTTTDDILDSQLPADISRDEIEDALSTAIGDLVERSGAELSDVVIRDIARVDWPDASLGKPEPDMLYAQVITPGFKMTFDVQGEIFVYHTSVDRVVFVGQGEGGDPVVFHPVTPEPVDGSNDDATETSDEDKAQLVNLALKWALVEQNIPDYNLLTHEKDEIVVSLENIEAEWVGDFAGVKLVFMTPDEIQQKANKEGDFLHIKFQSIDVTGEKADVQINNIWAVSETSTVGHLSGGGCTLQYEKASGEWTQGEQLGPCWIS